MDGLTGAEIEERLDGPLQAVLSVGRDSRGPIAVPISYHYDGERFFMVTSPSSQHGKRMVAEGRATITVQFEACDGRTVDQWYVTAEGPVDFTGDDPAPHVRAILAKDRGEANADDWAGNGPPDSVAVAVLTPERIAGYAFHDRLD